MNTVNNAKLRKSIVLALLLSVFMAAPVFAQSQGNSEKPIWDHGDNVSELSYVNVNIYKVLDGKDVYVILYEKHGLQMGQITVPKRWAKETPRKLQFRKRPNGIKPYMTVFYKNGEFYKLWLSMPVSRNDSAWGVVPNGTSISDSGSDSFDIEY